MYWTEINIHCWSRQFVCFPPSGLVSFIHSHIWFIIFLFYFFIYGNAKTGYFKIFQTKLDYFNPPNFNVKPISVENNKSLNNEFVFIYVFFVCFFINQSLFSFFSSIKFLIYLFLATFCWQYNWIDDSSWLDIYT